MSKTTRERRRERERERESSVRMTMPRLAPKTKTTGSREAKRGSLKE